MTSPAHAGNARGQASATPRYETRSAARHGEKRTILAVVHDLDFVREQLPAAAGSPGA